MTSATDIKNRAFVKLGTQRIAAPSDNSEGARVADTVFAGLAKAELRKHAWSFALKRATLAALAPPAIGTFRTAFNLPSDLLRLVQFNDRYVQFGLGLVSNAPAPEYAIEGRTLVCNDSVVKIRYIADLSADTSKWDDTFIEAFACRLAAEMAPTLTKDKQKVRDLMAMYKDEIQQAKRANAIELPPQEVPDSSWVTSRYTYG